MAEDMGFFADRRQRERRRFSGWHVLVLLGLVSRKPMANGLQLTKKLGSKAPPNASGTANA